MQCCICLDILERPALTACAHVFWCASLQRVSHDALHECDVCAVLFRVVDCVTQLGLHPLRGSVRQTVSVVLVDVECALVLHCVCWRIVGVLQWLPRKHVSMCMPCLSAWHDSVCPICRSIIPDPSTIIEFGCISTGDDGDFVPLPALAAKPGASGDTTTIFDVQGNKYVVPNTIADRYEKMMRADGLKLTTLMQSLRGILRGSADEKVIGELLSRPVLCCRECMVVGALCVCLVLFACCVVPFKSCGDFDRWRCCFHITRCVCLYVLRAVFTQYAGMFDRIHATLKRENIEYSHIHGGMNRPQRWVVRG